MFTALAPRYDENTDMSFHYKPPAVYVILQVSVIKAPLDQPVVLKVPLKNVK